MSVYFSRFIICGYCWITITARLCLAVPEPPLAKPPFATFTIDVLNAEAGVPSNRISGLAQGADGYLWLISDESLIRFDGIRFVEVDVNRLALDSGPTESANFPFFGRLFSGKSGAVWASIASGFLWRWNGHQLESWTSDRTDHQPVVQAFELSRSELLTVTRGGKVIRCRQHRSDVLADMSQWGRLVSDTICLDKESNLWCLAEHGKLLRAALSGEVQGMEIAPAVGHPRALVVDSAGQIWLGTSRGLFHWHRDHFAPAPLPEPSSSLSIRSIVPVGPGGFWILTEDQRAWFWDSSHWSGPIEVNSVAGRPFVHAIDREGRLWFASEGPGLWCLEQDGSAHHLGPKEGLNSDVTALLCDREGNIWANISSVGMARIRERRFQSLRATDGQRQVPLWNVAEDGQKCLWFFPEHRGPVAWKPGDGADLALGPVPAPRGPWTKALAVDQKGCLWFAARQAGIRPFCESPPHPLMPWPSEASFARVLFEDHAGTWWLGSDSSLHSWSDQAWHLWDKESGLPPYGIRAVTEDASGTLWVGTFGGGLARLDGNHFSRWSYPDRPGLDSIYTIYPGKDGSLWIGTQGGLVRHQAGRFTRYDMAQGLPDARVVQILEDARGSIWLGTRDGLCRITLASINAVDRDGANRLDCTTFDEHDGLPSRIFQDRATPACCRTSDGRLLFLTAGGAAWCDPASFGRNGVALPAIIERVRIDGIAQADPGRSEKWVMRPSEAAAALATGTPGSITLPPGSHSLEIDYTSNCLTAPEKVRFEYQMEGFDDQWIQAGNRRSVLYTLRTPGEYWFRLRSRNNNGKWSETINGLNVIVQPFFWQRPWFPSLALMGLVSVTGMCGAVAQRMRWRHRLATLEIQQAREEERTRIARDLHDHLGASLTEISMLAEDASDAESRRGEGNLRQIATKTRQMVDELDGIVWAVDPRQDTLPALASYLAGAVESHTVTAGFRPRLNIQRSLPSWLVCAEARHNLHLAVREAVHNALRHSGGSEIAFTLQLIDHALLIKIEDNGRGFDGSTTWIGNGLENMRERLKAIGGNCAIDSASGLGTCVSLHFPIPNRS